MAPNRRLKQARELRGWSQAKVAEKIGTDATTVSRWERGLFSPTPYFREKLCKLFGQNAEELGLLEATDQPRGYEQRDPFLQFPTAMPFFQANGEWSEEDEYPENTLSSLPPSWPKRADTFSYILRSAMHDQQAHMLWGDAYVRELHGQHAEAQQLGEASLNAFEHVGHLNATAIREWLNQRKLVSSSSPPTNIPPMPPPIRPEQRPGPARRLMTRKEAGIILMLIIVVALAYAGFALNQPGQTALASPAATHTQSAAPTKTHAPAMARPTGNPTSTLVPSPTTAPAQSPALTVQIQPSSLTPQNCFSEPLGYRCTLNIWLSTTNNQGKIPWHASSTNLLAQFNPFNGWCSPGASLQVIVYIRNGAGQKGQLIFSFTFASNVYTTSVTWQG